MYEEEATLKNGDTVTVEYDGVCELHDECDCSLNEAIQSIEELREPQEYSDYDMDEDLEELLYDDEPCIEESMSEDEIDTLVLEGDENADYLIACLEQDDFIDRNFNKTDINLDDYIEKTQYEDLEKKLKTQDEELGEYRSFIKDITPLMEKLEGKDEIVQAILDDKITVELAKNLLDNKLSQNINNEVNNKENQTGKILDSEDAIKEEQKLEKEHEIELEEQDDLSEDIENELDENLEDKDTINIDSEEISNSETFLAEQSYKQIYDAYINSDEWTEKKIEIANIYKLNDWDVECVKCGYQHNLQVHHNYYIDNKYFGHENISDTDYLCAKCHKEWHKIQKASGLSQNRLLEKYYDFIIDDEARTDQINYLLAKKIKIDTLEVERYFLRADVIEYNKISARLNWIFFIAFILLFVYGIGIIIMIIVFFIDSNNKEPENFDLYKQKRNSLESKKCHLELRKYHNITKEDEENEIKIENIPS